MSINYLRGATEWALMLALVFGAGAVARAQDQDRQDEKVIRIGKSDQDQTKPNLPLADRDQRETESPKYWIGLLGGPIPADHVLRAQLDLPANQGLLVGNVVPNSPAAKAGLKQHDVLLKAINSCGSGSIKTSKSLCGERTSAEKNRAARECGSA